MWISRRDRAWSGMARTILALPFALLFALSRIAAAEPTPSDDDLRAAKAHFERGEQAYARHDYKVAIEAYVAAFRIAPFPELVFNIGQAHRLAGNDGRALEAYRLYVALYPDRELAAEASGHIMAFQARGVVATEDLAAAKRGDGWAMLDAQITKQREVDDAAFRHRRLRFVAGAGVSVYTFDDQPTAPQLALHLGASYRIAPLVTVEPRVRLAIHVADPAYSLDVSNRTSAEVQARVFAYPEPWLFAGGGLGLGLSECASTVHQTPSGPGPDFESCSGGVVASAFLEAGVLVADRYQVSVQLHPAWLFHEADDYDDEPGVAVFGLSFAYHL